MNVEPKIIVRSRRGRSRPYVVIQNSGETTVKARTASEALGKVELQAGAIVTVTVPYIVHAKRARSGI